MIKVTVKPFFCISDALGKKGEIELSLNYRATTILGLLSLLRKPHNLPDEIHVNRFTLELFEKDEIRSLMVLKNGKNIKSLDRLKTKLEDGSNQRYFRWWREDRYRRKKEVNREDKSQV